MNRLILFAVTSLMFACQSPPTKATHQGVGLWKEKSPNREAITLRNADGAMKRKEIRRFDYSSGGEYFISEWHWSIRGDCYRITLRQISGDAWKKNIGKTWNLKVLSLDENMFRYLSSDGAIVEETRIGSASNAAFDEARLPSL
jgi:hypothetical protein